MSLQSHVFVYCATLPILEITSCILPSGNPELTRISFNCTLASQVILRVAMLSLLCSQKCISAFSPPSLQKENVQDKLICNQPVQMLHSNFPYTELTI